MELEFDKEIDAILRRAGGRDAVETTAAGSHLDADTINAFVENALPERAKGLYMAHFADCGRCRKLLSSSISLNTAAVSAAGIAAENVAENKTAVAAIPWYSRLFRTPNLALSMGALVLMFSGILGYLVLRDKNASAPAISQLKPPEIESSAPSASSNAAANTTVGPGANSNAAAANTAALSEPLAESPRGPGGPSANSPGSPATSGTTSTDTLSSGSQPTGGMPAASAPPPPPPAPVTMAKKAEPADTGGSGSRSADDKDEKEKTAESIAEESRARRDMPAAAAKTGPSRAGPAQIQSNNVNQSFGDMTVTRKAGGKTFTNRDGAWYDSAYHGQATTNVRRGTEEFKKLDSSVRSIANQIGGVVVIVHGGKAYRIN